MIVSILLDTVDRIFLVPAPVAVLALSSLVTVDERAAPRELTLGFTGRAVS